jgi:hypothetical protein
MRYLTEEDAAKLPPDLDREAVNDLLGMMPRSIWDAILTVLSGPTQPKNSDASGSGVHAMLSQTLGSTNFLVQNVIARIYASRDQSRQNKEGE